ncbi:MAG: undecaprenyl-diphosphate phosphatase, partial [archaeon]
MNELVISIILAIVQGLTEWLPVSSSGHLVIFHELLDYHPGLYFDVALHFGTLMAVFVYFGKDIVDIIEAMLKGKWKSENGKLGLLLIVATIPAGIIGYVFNKLFEAAFNSLMVAALGFAVTGMILLIASIEFRKNDKKQPSYRDAVMIGFAQVLAILPGVSRSGSTISAGLLRGLDEKSALRFSFLMSIPVIFGAGLIEIGNKTLPSDLIWATLIAFIVGLATIWFLFRVVSNSKKNLRWFAAYVLLLSLSLLIW